MELSKEGDIESPSKKSRISEEEKDVISLLPDSILVRILSFLPTLDATKTVLVRRFGNLWRSLRVLDFDECLFHQCYDNRHFEDDPNDKEKFLSIVHHILGLQESRTLDKLRLQINFFATYSRSEKYAEDPEHEEIRCKEKSIANDIDLLLRRAINKNAKVLDLDFEGCSWVHPSECYILPDIVWQGCFLTELRLSNCEIGSCGEVNLRLLKFMSLKEVVVNDKIMATILRSCPMLESLSLSDCYNLKTLNCTNPRLKKLMIYLYESYEILTVSAPDLLYLNIDGCIDRVLLVNVSSIVKSSLWFSSGFMFQQEEYVEVKRIFQKLSNSKIVIPCTWCMLVFSIWKLTNVPCQSFNWESLTLPLCLSKWHHPGISLLLRNSRCLETLTMHIFPRWGKDFENEAEKWLKAYDFDVEKFWNSQEPTFYHLKTVMIYAYITEPHVTEIVKFLLRNAIFLEKMVISTKKVDKKFSCYDPGKKNHFTSEELLEYSQKLLSFPRASTKAVIYFN